MPNVTRLADECKLGKACEDIRRPTSEQLQPFTNIPSYAYQTTFLPYDQTITLSQKAKPDRVRYTGMYYCTFIRFSSITFDTCSLAGSSSAVPCATLLLFVSFPLRSMADYTDLKAGSLTISSPIRRSCYFCRSRKIRCSGGQVCTACRARNMDCVYSKETSKGRPKGSKSVSISLKGALQKELDNAALPNSPQDQTNDDETTLSNLIHFPLHLPSSTHWPTAATTDFSNTPQRSSITKDLLIGKALEDVFGRKFQGDLRPVQTTGLADPSFMSEVALQYPAWHQGVSDTATGSTTDALFGSFSKISPLLNLTQDLVELVSKRMGSLGISQREDTPTCFVSSFLTQDKRFTMFGVDTEPEPLPKYSDHQLSQLIELWVFHHPLSFLVSKTLLLHSYRIQTHDQSLIAVVLGGACVALGDAESMQGQRFFEWAELHLRRRNARSPSISTVQVLILLGWYKLCGSDIRRAFCYIEMARIALQDIRHRSNDTPLTNVDRINGVHVGKVELDLCQRMYWVAFALDLWAAMQMNVSFDVPTVPDTDVKLPPLEKTASAAYMLDEKSGNSAALMEQEKSIQELWSLSHVASTVGHIYVLYPRQAAAVSTSALGGWESQIIPRLRQLVDGPRKFSIVCQGIRCILSDGINTIVAHMGSQSSEFFVLSAYRTLIIQLLFPRSEPDIPTEIIADAVYDDIIYFVGAFKVHAEILCRPPSDSSVKELGSAESCLLVLGLDTCSRALYQLHLSLKLEATVIEGWSTTRRDRLAQLAKEMHRICKYPKLRTAPTLALVKKHLKRLSQDFEPADPVALVQDCVSRPADTFPGWFAPASDPQITPISGISNFDNSGGFDFGQI